MPFSGHDGKHMMASRTDHISAAFSNVRVTNQRAYEIARPNQLMRPFDSVVTLQANHIAHVASHDFVFDTKMQAKCF